MGEDETNFTAIYWVAGLVMVIYDEKVTDIYCEQTRPGTTSLPSPIVWLEPLFNSQGIGESLGSLFCC